MQAVTSRPEWAAEFDFVACGPRDIKGKVGTQQHLAGLL